MANTQFILQYATIESFVQMIKERFCAAIDMEKDLILQTHHTLSCSYNKEFHDELVKRLWNAPLEIKVEDDRSVIELIAGTDPKILGHSLDNYQNLTTTFIK